MKGIIDLRGEKFGITAEPMAGSQSIKVTFDNASIEAILKINACDSIDLAEALLDVNGEKTTSEWEEEVYKLQEEVNNLQEIIEEYEERMDYMRRKEAYIPF